MRGVVGFLIIVFLNSDQVFAIDISGYYENQLSVQVKQKQIAMQPRQLAVQGDGIKFSLMNYNRLRIDIGSDLGENIVLKGNFIAQTFHGRTKFNILDFIPKKFGEEVRCLPPEIRMFELKDRYVLDNIFVSFHLPFITIRAGKQQIP